MLLAHDDDDEITVPGVYLGDLNSTTAPQFVPVVELDAAEVLDESDYLTDDEEPIPVSIEEIPTNPRFSISAVSGVVPIPPSERTERPSVPANELYRRVWFCSEEE
jgi:hypothetical protein